MSGAAIVGVGVHLPGVALLEGNLTWEECSEKPTRLPGARPGHGQYVCRAIKRRASHNSCKGIQALHGP